MSVSPEQVLEAGGALHEYREPERAIRKNDGVPPLETVSVDILAGRPVPKRVFLDAAGFFPMRNVTILSGDGGTGKSLLALQLAVAVAAGRKWLDLEVSSGAVLYLSAEDDLDELHARLDAITRAEGLSLGELDQLHLAVRAGEDAVMAIEKEGGSIQTTAFYARLERKLADDRPALLVLDNLADIFAGNENVRSLARQFMGRLRRLAIDHGCAILLLAHPSLSGMNSGSGTSGNTAWNNSARSRLYLQRKRDGTGLETDPADRSLKVMKANYGPVGGELALRYQDGRFTRTGMAALNDDPDARAVRVRRVFVDLMKWHADRSLALSASPSPNHAPKLFAEHPMSEGLRKDEFAGEMKRLLGENILKIVPEGPPSRRRNRLVLAEDR